MIPGETILSGADPHCPDCGKLLKFKVLKSQVGYYIGTYCCGGPFTRESGYYQTKEAAQEALNTGDFGR